MKRNVLVIFFVLAMALVMVAPVMAAGNASCGVSGGHPVGPGGNARSAAACAQGDMPLVISIHRGAGLTSYGLGNGYVAP